MRIVARAWIEVVALSEERDAALLAECKWKQRPVGLVELEKLQERARRVASDLHLRRMHLALFARAGFTPALSRAARATGVMLVTPRDMVRSVRSRRAY